MRTSTASTKKTANAVNTVRRDSLTTGDLKANSKNAVMTRATSDPLSSVITCSGRET